VPSKGGVLLEQEINDRSTGHNNECGEAQSGGQASASMPFHLIGSAKQPHEED